MLSQAIGTQPICGPDGAPALRAAFPEYLRELGYYTTNNSKTSYNLMFP